MTSQQIADEALQRWQSMRALPPEERIEVLFLDFFAPLSPLDIEYDITMRLVEEYMA